MGKSSSKKVKKKVLVEIGDMYLRLKRLQDLYLRGEATIVSQREYEKVIADLANLIKPYIY